MLKTIATAAAASALLAGAAFAQTGSAGAGVTPNQSSPATASDAQTGVPSVDSTRPAGGSLAGSTNMPAGQVNGTADATTSSTDTSTTSSTDTSVNGSATVSASSSMPNTASASAGTTTDASAVVSTQTVTNGPVPDTPENRAKYRPMSRAGRATSPASN